MMTEVPTRFRELSVCKQAECFLVSCRERELCEIIAVQPDRLEAKFWLVLGELNCRKLTWFLFLKINIFLEKMWAVLKGGGTAKPQLCRVTAASDVILLVFAKRPQTQSTRSCSPRLGLSLFTRCLVTTEMPECARLQSCAWEAEIVSRDGGVWATEQNPVSEYQNKQQTIKRNQDKDPCPHGNWILMINLSESNPLAGRLYTGGTQQLRQWGTFSSPLGPSERYSGDFCTVPYFLP